MRDFTNWTEVWVENLNDSGPGSFRAAAMMDFPRTIRFGVGGTIALTSGAIRMNGADGSSMCYIDAASAPGMGVQVTGAGVYLIDVQDVYVNGLRCRPGQDGQNTNQYPLLIYAQNGYCDDIYVWDSSFSGADGDGETFDILSSPGGLGVRKVHVKDCIIARPAVGTVNGQPHATGLLVSGSASDNLDLTVEGCLIAQSMSRNPLLATKGRVMFRRNLVADWTSYAGEIDMPDESNAFYSILGNIFWRGPSNQIAYERRPWAVSHANPGSIDARGNIVLGYTTQFENQLQLFGVKGMSPSTSQVFDPSILITNAGGNWGTTPQDARDLLARVGPKVRDGLDKSIIESLLTGSAYDLQDWSTPTLASVPYDLLTKNMQLAWTQNPTKL